MKIKLLPLAVSIISAVGEDEQSYEPLDHF